jgi:uncharacterized protein
MSSIDELVKDFLSQKNIAVAGIKRDGKGVGNIVYKRLKESGHQVYPIHPEIESYEEGKCYPDVKSIDDKIDGVFIATNPSVSEQIVGDCIEAGINRVWIHNMFGVKGANKPTTSLTDKAVQMCRDNNISVIPGGCPLMFCEPVDFGHKCIRGITRMIGGFRI